MAAGEAFWRDELPGIEGNYAQAGPAYGVRERALPKHG